jgi:hypothetical protein
VSAASPRHHELMQITRSSLDTAKGPAHPFGQPVFVTDVEYGGQA